MWSDVIERSDANIYIKEEFVFFNVKLNVKIWRWKTKEASDEAFAVDHNVLLHDR